MISVDKTCFACDTVCTFSIRTLFTAPSRFPEWKCSQFGFECNVESDKPILTVAPERWAVSVISSPATTLTLTKKELAEPLTSAPVPPRASVSLAKAALTPHLPESFRIDTAPALLDSTLHRDREVTRSPSDTPPSDRGRNSDLPRAMGDSAHSYLTWTQISVERRTSQQTTSLITYGTSALRRATPSHYIVGDPLLRMMQPDPTRIQVSEFAREIHSSLWRGLRKDLDKWTTSRKAALFEAKGTPLEITNWDNIIGTFFADNEVTNPIFQARLAMQTFRSQALFWWRAHSSLLPELVVTYEQLLE